MDRNERIMHELLLREIAEEYKFKVGDIISWRERSEERIWFCKIKDIREKDGTELWGYWWHKKRRKIKKLEWLGYDDSTMNNIKIEWNMMYKNGKTKKSITRILHQHKRTLHK